MIKTSISLQELRKRMYTKAKADKAWRFWGLYVHVCKEETLREAYRLVRANRGAPGIDGATFDAIEAGGLDAFFQQLRGELISGAYRPMRNRRKAISVAAIWLGPAVLPASRRAEELVRVSLLRTHSRRQCESHRIFHVHVHRMDLAAFHEHREPAELIAHR